MVSRSAREKKQFPLFSPFPLFLLFFQFRLNLFFLNAEMHVACLRKALEMEPENPTALYRLAMSYPEGSPERVQYFEQGLRSGSTSCGVLLLEETQGELDERQYLNAVGRIGMLCGATHERFNHLEELINIVQRTADERTRYDAAKILLDWREIDVRGFRLHNLRSEQLELTRSEIEWYLRRVELYRRAALTWIWAARHIPEAKDIVHKYKGIKSFIAKSKLSVEVEFVADQVWSYGGRLARSGTECSHQRVVQAFLARRSEAPALPPSRFVRAHLLD